MLRDLEGVATVEDRRPKIAAFASHLSSVAESAGGMNEIARTAFEALKQGSDDNKLEILKSLDQSAHPVVLALVRELAINPGDETLRVAAIDALVEILRNDSAEVLSRIVTEPGPLPVRAEAALALKSIVGSAESELLNRTVKAISGEPTIASLFADLGTPSAVAKAI